MGLTSLAAFSYKNNPRRTTPLEVLSCIRWEDCGITCYILISITQTEFPRLFIISTRKLPHKQKRVLYAPFQFYFEGVHKELDLSTENEFVSRLRVHCPFILSVFLFVRLYFNSKVLVAALRKRRKKQSKPKR